MTSLAASDPVIRPFRPGDEADVAEICLRTGRAGTDASGLYRTPDLIANVYATPYVTHDPELAVVLDNGSRVVGYAIATADTREFASWFSREWWPSVRPNPVPDDDASFVASADDPDRLLIADVDDYPAHLHIDLLPEAQGRGIGRRALAALFERLRQRGVSAVHLGLDPNNSGASAFYDRLGFVPLLSSDPSGFVRGRAL